MILCETLLPALLNTWITVSPILFYTQNHEIPTFSYAYSQKKGTPFGKSLPV